MAKNILLHFSGEDRHEIKTDMAIRMANIFDAGITGLYASEVWHRGGARPREGDIGGDEAKAGRVKAAFFGATEARGVAAEWLMRGGDARASILFLSCFADLIVMGQSGPEESDQAPDLPNDVAMAAGRPVLVVPHSGTFEQVGTRVMVAWNNSRVASRAMHDAMPILEQAAEVVVLSVNAKQTDQPTSEDVREHLAGRGINAEAVSTAVQEVSTGNALLSRAHDLGVDLVVMGAYGGSRIRETLVGGTTRHVLETMTRPVLLSH